MKYNGVNKKNIPDIHDKLTLGRGKTLNNILVLNIREGKKRRKRHPKKRE